MNMKLLAFSVLSIIGLSACDGFDGRLNLTKSTRVLDTSGATHTLAPGAYNTDIDSSLFGGKIKFSIQNRNGDKIKFQFKAPSELRNENYQGPLKLRSGEIGQSFDVIGNLALHSRRSGPFRTSESCIYDTYTRRRCHTAYDRNGRPYSHCETYTEYVYGVRDIEYETISTTRSGDLQLVDASSRASLGTFRGTQQVSSRNVTLYAGYCRR